MAKIKIDMEHGIFYECPECGGDCSSWIPVEERLPEAGEYVLAWYEYFRYGDYNKMFQTYGIGFQYDGNWSGDVFGTKARCIAWMPLPEPFVPQN